MFTEKIASLWDQLKVVFSDFAFTDFLDICLVAFILYSVIKLIRETKAIQLAKGLLLFGVAYLAIYLLDMQASEFIFKKVFGEIIIVLVILFQPELRHMLESVGRRSITKLNLFGVRDEETERNQKIKDSIYAVCKACQSMSESKTGSLIVFEHDTLLGDIIKSGTPVDAIVSRELIGNIFYHGAPLHDGAAVIRDGRVVAAGCVLPLTSNTNLSPDLGTRHRAGIGMSEHSDAVVVIVSEETGTISVAVGGMLKRHLAPQTLDKLLHNELCPANDGDEKQDLSLRLKQKLQPRRKETDDNEK